MGIIDGSNLSSPTLFGGETFNNINSLIFDEFVIKDISLNSNFSKGKLSALLTSNSASVVIIKKMLISNVTFTNQSFMVLANIKQVILE